MQRKLPRLLARSLVCYRLASASRTDRSATPRRPRHPGAFYSRRGWPPAGAAGSIGAHVRARRRAMTTAERTLGTVARAGGLLGHARWMGRGRRRPVRWPSGVLRVRDVSRQRAGASRPPARPAGPGSGGRHMRVSLSEASDPPGGGPRDECHVGKDLLARAIAPAPAR